MDMVDVLVIGAGPAGLNAALYAARKELSVKVVTTDIGGQMLLTNEIENYLGFPSISGFELADKMEAHVKQYPVEFVYAGVKSLVKEADGTFTAHLDDGSELHGKTCIVTAGKHSRTLDIPGEKEYTGRGVSYCATCDAPFYRKKTVAVVGGGDSAVQAAIELAKLCPTVYLLVRSRIRAQEILVKRMKELDNVKVYLGYTPEEVKGEKKVTSLVIKNKADGKMEELTVDGVFVEAGGIPNNSYLPSDVKVNSLGEIMTNKDGETNVEGLFAAGDVTDCRNKQVIIAAGEGAAAALAAHEYLLRSGL
ncbi:NAD(P)/FAD-dependent oxidoreductase [uncultured Dialister sp.]|uniref:NAD(P)/FAD-dependent oxidoreductase n=1 Tax=uncultured Dialister sp. TaxID=278064 RepID=UPI0026376ADF|nr:FAD-dependent oxidoreductase [uncultured Dialister sp.]